MLDIAAYKKEHLDGIVDVILPIQKKEFNIEIELEDQPDLLDIPDFYQTGKGNFWVALVHSEVVGTISLLDIGRNQGALRKMFVKQAYRGENYKVAGNLLNVLFGWCRLKGINDVFLGTTPKFLAAHRFYEKNGFSEIRKNELPESFPVMAVDTKFYRIRLK